MNKSNQSLNFNTNNIFGSTKKQKLYELSKVSVNA